MVHNGWVARPVEGYLSNTASFVSCICYVRDRHDSLHYSPSSEENLHQTSSDGQGVPPETSGCQSFLAVEVSLWQSHRGLILHFGVDSAFEHAGDRRTAQHKSTST